MGTQISILGITGQSPFNIFVCQTGGTQCIFIDEVDYPPFEFIIPQPYDTLNSYMLKIVDGNNITITGQTIVLGL